jgi:hypothetical protein
MRLHLTRNGGSGPQIPYPEKRKQWLQGIMIALFAAAVFGCAATRSDIAPEKGFRDIKWGTPIEAVPGLKVLDKGGGSWKWGKRSEEALRIGDVEVDAITYIFIDGAFAGVDVDFSGHAAFYRLIEGRGKALGASQSVNKRLNMRAWKQDNTSIMIRYYRFQDAGTLKAMHGV